MQAPNKPWGWACMFIGVMGLFGAFLVAGISNPGEHIKLLRELFYGGISMVFLSALIPPTT